MSALQTALALAEEHGIPVFPCKHDKAPLTEHGFKDASRNIEQIAGWWEKHPEALVGVPTGSASKILVIDVDPDGAEWHASHIANLGGPRIHHTRRGRHLLYRMPNEPIKNDSLGKKLGDGIDVRADGGYIIYWPAHGFDVCDGGPELDELPPAPEWVLEKLREPERTSSAATAPFNGSGRIPEKHRNASLASLAGTMRRRGMDENAIYAALAETNGSRCDPPLSESDVRRIAKSIASYAPTKPLGSSSFDATGFAPLNLEDFELSDEEAEELADPTWIEPGLHSGGSRYRDRSQAGRRQNDDRVSPGVRVGP